MNAPRQEVLNIFQNNAESFNTQLQQLCDLLQRTLNHYTWVGFYFANADTRTLHLGPYCGAPTDHTSIPFGKGICGQVAESNTPFLVPDVSAYDVSIFLCVYAVMRNPKAAVGVRVAKARFYPRLE